MIKWNGRSLQGKNFREVYDIIAESRLEPQVELVVSRNLSSTTGPATMPAGLMPSTPMASRWIAPQNQRISGTLQPHHKGDYQLLGFVRSRPSSSTFFYYFFYYFFIPSYLVGHTLSGSVLRPFSFLLCLPSCPARVHHTCTLSSRVYIRGLLTDAERAIV